MIEDMQTGMMSTNQTTNASSQIQKRAPGGTMSIQHEFDRSKGGITSGGHGKASNRKGGKLPKQNLSWNNNRREVSGNRSSKKAPGDFTKSSKDQLVKRKDVLQKAYQSPEDLLNFHYMPLRSQYSSRTSDYHHGTRRRRTTFNKEVFLQANCQFVVDYDEERYMVHSMDPDILVEWDAIQLVYLPTHETPSCPICLYPPTAAKMTKCGHVYCWACVLHYLSLSDKSWNKCPICHEAVHDKDLKSVVPIVQNKFSRNGSIKMKLMRRPKNSLYTCPEDSWDPTSKQFSVWEGKPPNSHSKLTLAIKEMVLDKILLREKMELTAQLNEAMQDQTGEESFIQMASNKIEVEIKALAGLDSLATPIATSRQNLDEPYTDYGEESKLAEVLAQKESNFEEAFSEDEGESDEFENTSDVSTKENNEGCVPTERVTPKTDHDDSKHDKRIRNSESSSTDSSVEGGSEVMATMSTKNSEFYYFYQAEDGQNIFINSLNARCLIEQYGSLEKAPKKIVGQILDFESFTMSKELRKRYRYLSHLPLSCEFIICELMLRPPVLSKQTIHNFMGEFKKRKALRFKKMEEQRKHDLRANAEISRGAGYHVEKYQELEVQLDLTDLTDFPSNLSPEDVTGNYDNNNQIVVDGGEEEDTCKGPSFAQMLKTASATPGFQPAASKMAWGKESQRSEPDVFTRKLTAIGPQEDDDDGPNVVAPSLKEMFSAAMFSQGAINGAGSTEPSAENIVKSGKKGKKGKAKGTLLFSTGAQRKY